MTQRIEKHTHAAILRAGKILLVPHQRPDGDALGSVSAMMEWLKRIGKPHATFCATPLSERLLFLPHTGTIQFDDAVWHDPDIDMVVVFDSGDLSYAGVASHISQMPSRPTVLNIDHHATNELFGDINLVRPNAPSTTAILYAFFRSNDIAINPVMATGLLTGLVTDTDNFSNAATNMLSLKIASELVLKGGDLALINRWVMKDRSLGGLKLWGAMLSRIEHHTELDIVYTYVTQEDMHVCGVSESEVEGMANFLNALEDGQAAMILTERADGTVKGSFRTTLDHMDVARFAKAFGGGGHKKAAGFTVAGPVDTAIETIFSTIANLEIIE